LNDRFYTFGNSDSSKKCYSKRALSAHKSRFYNKLKLL